MNGEINIEEKKETVPIVEEKVMPIEIAHKEDGKTTIIKHDYRIVDNRKLNLLLILNTILIILILFGFAYIHRWFAIRGI